MVLKLLLCIKHLQYSQQIIFISSNSKCYWVLSGRHVLVSSSIYCSVQLRKYLSGSSLLLVSGRPMVVSSGMQSMETMRQAYKTVKEHNKNFVILQCTSTYPLSPDEVNLRVIGVTKTV